MSTTPPKPFVVLAMPRTGSTYLIDVLSSHPHIYCYPAFFGRVWQGAAEPKRSKDMLLLHHAAQLVRKLGAEWNEQAYRIAHWRELWQHMRDTCADKHAIGFKHMLSAVPGVTEHVAVDPGIKKIYLKRDNLLAAFSSNQLARLTGQSHILKGEDRTPSRLEFNASDFDRFVVARQRMFDRWLAHLPETGIAGENLVTTYARIRTLAGIDEVVSFLGEDSALLGESAIVKRNSDDVLTRFTNPEAVTRYLERIGRPEWVTEASAQG